MSGVSSIKIPPDLPVLMKELARVILRDSPTNIYEYAAQYFENLLRERDGELHKSYGGNELKKSATIDREKLLGRYNEVRPQPRTIHTRISEKKFNVGEVQEEGGDDDGRWVLGRAAIRIQKAYRQYRARKEGKIQKTIVSKDEQNESKNTQSGGDDTPLMSDKDHNVTCIRSAILIQKLIRGYVARKRFAQLKLEMAELRQLQEMEFEEVGEICDSFQGQPVVAVQKRSLQALQKSTEHETPIAEVKPIYEKEAEESLVELYELINAATRIQKVFRGFKARKEFKERVAKRDSVSSVKTIFTGSKFNKNESEELPNFATMEQKELNEFEKAASTIQNVYKGFKATKNQPQSEDEVQFGTLTEQTPRDEINSEDLPDFGKMDKKELSEFEKAAGTIQNVYRGFKKDNFEKTVEVSDINGENTQKQQDDMKTVSNGKSVENMTLDDLSDFNKIEAKELGEFEKADQGLKSPKTVAHIIPVETLIVGENKNSEELPDFSKMGSKELGEFEKAASTMQTVYKGFKSPKKDFKKSEETVKTENLTNFEKSATSEEKSPIIELETKAEEYQETEALPDFSKMDTKELGEFEKAATTIQNVFKGIKSPKKAIEPKAESNARKESVIENLNNSNSQEPDTKTEIEKDELPDFAQMDKSELNEFEKAAGTIQNVYRGFKSNKNDIRQDLPEKSNESVQNVAEELQNFEKMEQSELRDFEKAAGTIQNVYKGFKSNKNENEEKLEEPKEVEELPDFSKMAASELREFEKAAGAIQNVYRGFKVSKTEQTIPVSSPGNTAQEAEKSKDEELPNFETMSQKELSEFEKAAGTMQNVYRGFKTDKNSKVLEKENKTAKPLAELQTELTENDRKNQKEFEEERSLANTDELPDFSAMEKSELMEFEKAASTIQNVYKSFKSNKIEIAPKGNVQEELLELEKVATTIKNGVENTKEIDEKLSKMSTLELKPENSLIKAATNIQRIFRGYKTRKDLGLVRSILERRQKGSDTIVRSKPARVQRSLDRIEEEASPAKSIKIIQNDVLEPTLSDTEVSETLIAALVEGKEHEEKIIEGEIVQEQEFSNQDPSKPVPTAPELDIETGENLEKPPSTASSQKLGFDKLGIDSVLSSSEPVIFDEQRKMSEDSVFSESIVDAPREGDDQISIDSLMIEKTLKQEDSDLDDSLEPIPIDDEVEIEAPKTKSEEVKMKRKESVEMSVAEIIQQSTKPAVKPNVSEKNKFQKEAFSSDRKSFGALRKSTETGIRKPREIKGKKAKSADEVAEKASSQAKTVKNKIVKKNDSKQEKSEKLQGLEIVASTINVVSKGFKKEPEVVPETRAELGELPRQATVEEPPCVRKNVTKTFPEILDEVTEIVSFDTATHEKSRLEEEYYSLKKKQIDPEMITAVKKQTSIDEPETNSVESDHISSTTTDSSSSRLTQIEQRTMTTESDDVVLGRMVSEDLDRTAIFKNSKPLNKTFSADDDVVTGTVPELDVTYTILKEEEPSLDETFIVETDNDTLEELKSLSDVPNRRRLVSSVSLMQPAETEDFNPMNQSSIYMKHYMDRLHGSITDDTAYGSDRDGEEDDQFDEFYNSQNVRQKIMASSFSVADSDYFDLTHKPVETDDDSRIVTALEAITSTETDSSSVSTKIPNTDREKAQMLSFGDTAITGSLEEYAMQAELPSLADLDETAEGGQVENSAAETLSRLGKTIQIKLEHKPSSESSMASASGRRSSESSASDDNRAAAFRDSKASYYSLNVDKYDTAARRLLLQRENAVQGNSTPEDDLSAKSNGSTEIEVKDADKLECIVEPKTEEGATSVPDETKSHEDDSMKRSNPILRQRTLPVQIDTSIMRILPRHVVKRIKSADNPKRKLFSKPSAPSNGKSSGNK